MLRDLEAGGGEGNMTADARASKIPPPFVQKCKKGNARIFAKKKVGEKGEKIKPCLGNS